MQARNIRRFDGITPTVPPGVFVDETALVIGDCVLGEEASVWPMAVIRADVNSVRIGARSNIQDFAMLHESHRRPPADPEGAPLTIGDDVTVGHHVTLHGCTIGNRVLVGIGSIVLDRAVIEDDVIIGAGSLVPPSKRLESGGLYVGSPVKRVRDLTDEEKAFLPYSAAHYVRLAARHASGE
ncbi:MAG: gamma carbonic anhydrase family protein [Laribacter sp.]|nr:gamma carbonic anhydrase family protein [Laribacter sp.]MBP9526976.1 gamma carbonic anhydrase family protein [Laribacter sp.]MBP9608041.1 gamma carbonic anhydrase family protein [Laribacter sp.]